MNHAYYRACKNNYVALNAITSAVIALVISNIANEPNMKRNIYCQAHILETLESYELSRYILL